MVLHVLALAPAAIGLCCLAADWWRARLAELAAALLMMIAMADASVTSVVPVVGWIAVLVVAAMALAAVRGRARGHLPSDEGVAVVGTGPDPIMAVHSAVGMIVMAGLFLVMSGGVVPGSGGHHHGAGPGVGVGVGLLAAGYLVASTVLAARSRGRLDRAQYVAMAASVGLMSLALVG